MSQDDDEYPEAHSCDECGGAVNQSQNLVWCDECARMLCLSCDGSVHANPQCAEHVRAPLDAEEYAEEITEHAMLELLDDRDDPFALCRRLFRADVDIAMDALADGLACCGSSAAGLRCDCARHLFACRPPGTLGSLGGRALRRLSVPQIAHLHDHGFVVLTGLVPDSVTAAVHATASSLAASGGLQRALRPDEDVWRDQKSRGDLIAWLHGAGCAAPGVAEALEALDGVRADVSAALQDELRADPEVQLALYPGGGAGYVRHRDGYPRYGDGSDERRVTCILYCNSGWDASAHGGCLRLFLRGGCGTVDVEPHAGTAVVFMSGAVEHEVLPAYRDRVALTAWFH